MTVMVVLTVLGSFGGLAVLLLMAAAPLLAQLSLPRPAREVEVSIPVQRTAADPVRRPLHAA